MRRELLTSLEEHFPNLNLDLEMRWGDPSTLQSSPLLHSLRVYFAPSKLDTTGTSPLLTHVQTQIMDSPNLVELSMGINSMGCVIYRTDPKFARLKEKRFPHLEKLSLEAFPLTVENVDYWMANMDWSHVEHLDLRAIYQPTYFFNESIKLAGGLPQLKALHMELPWFREGRDLQEFEEVFRQFLDTPRNTGLSVIALEGDFQPYLQTILNRHGGSLKRLQLHDPERSHGPQREMLSDSDLRDLGQRAPHLEDISIDINNGLNGSLVSCFCPSSNSNLVLNHWPRQPMGFVETLLSETGFPSLKTIELFGILGVSDPVRVSDWPYVPTDQRPLLSKLFSRPAINQVKIHVGEDRRLGGGYPARWVLWEQDNQELVRLPPSIVHRPLTNRGFQWVAERDASGEMVLKASPRVWDEEGYGWREGYH